MQSSVVGTWQLLNMGKNAETSKGGKHVETRMCPMGLCTMSQHCLP